MYQLFESQLHKPWSPFAHKRGREKTGEMIAKLWTRRPRQHPVINHEIGQHPNTRSKSSIVTIHASRTLNLFLDFQETLRLVVRQVHRLGKRSFGAFDVLVAVQLNHRRCEWRSASFGSGDQGHQAQSNQNANHLLPPRHHFDNRACRRRRATDEHQRVPLRQIKHNRLDI